MLDQHEIEDMIQEMRDKDEEWVDLIASGYEWTCPNCEHLNHTIEVKEIVECEDCKKIYKVDDAEHAYS